MRVINASVLSRGQQNTQVMTQGRKFLSENRLTVTAVLKRSAKLGNVDSHISDDLVEELADAYVLLISLTKFLDVSSLEDLLTLQVTYSQQFEEKSRPRSQMGISFT